MGAAPKKRFYVAVKGGRVYFFVVVPKRATVAPASRSPASESTGLATQLPSIHSAWDAGSATVPLKLSCNGELLYCPELPRSSFESFQQAAEECGPFEAVDEYAACFGAVLLDKFYLLVAAKVELAMELPFGDVVHRVLETKWVGVTVPQVPKVLVDDRDARRLKEFALHSHHAGFYYSDEADLSLPFPFSAASRSAAIAPPLPDLACDWSYHLRKPFDRVGMGVACSALIRGFVGEQRLGMQDGQIVRMQLIGRQNHMNPGPRYYGRGLNHADAAGNDHTYEYVMWRYVDEAPDANLDDYSAPVSPSSSSLSPPLSPRRKHTATVVRGLRGGQQRTAIEFTRHTILRGTIPVHWTTEIPTGIGEGVVHFDPDPNKVTKGSAAYFRKVFQNISAFVAHDQARLARQAVLEPESGTLLETMPHACLRCVNMLRQSSNPPEEALSRRFVDAVRRAAAELDGDLPIRSGASTSSNSSIELAHVDWLNLIKEYRMETAVGTLWQNIVPFLAPAAQSNAEGGADSGLDGVSAAVSSAVSPSMSPRASPVHCLQSARQARDSPLVSHGTLGKGMQPAFSSVQTNFVRVNCADSLDRTNLGCFFTCLQASLEMLAQMQVSFDDFIDDTPIPALPGDSSSDSDADAQPAAGLDIPDEAVLLGITEVQVSSSGSPRKGPSATAQRSTNRFRQPFLRSWNDIRDGRRCPPAVARALCELFVGNGDTVAMMYTNSAALHSNVLRTIAGMKQAKSNAVISAQRRFENVFEDRKKFRHLEVLLGRNIELHFPSLSAVYLLRPLPYASWGWSLVVAGIPRGATAADIEESLREHWDAVVVPNVQSSSGQVLPLVDSTSLCMHVVVEDAAVDSDVLNKEAFVVNSSVVVFHQQQAPAGEGDELGDEGFYDIANGDYVAVVEFDEDTCKVVDVVSLFLAHRAQISLTRFPSAQLTLRSYEYPMDRTDGTKSIATSASDAMKKAANSLKSGFKNLVRGLN